MSYTNSVFLKSFKTDIFESSISMVLLKISDIVEKMLTEIENFQVNAKKDNVMLVMRK